MLGGEEQLTGVSLLETDEVGGPGVLQVRQSRLAAQAPLSSLVAQGQIDAHGPFPSLARRGTVY